jgi:RimJ/RimL family protein N-acetyltransferase
LLRQLASIAGEKGIRLFEAEVLAENQQIMRVLKDSGFHVAQELERGLCRVILSIAPTLVLEERPLEREKVAATEPQSREGTG